MIAFFSGLMIGFFLAVIMILTRLGRVKETKKQHKSHEYDYVGETYLGE